MISAEVYTSALIFVTVYVVNFSSSSSKNSTPLNANCTFICNITKNQSTMTTILFLAAVAGSEEIVASVTAGGGGMVVGSKAKFCYI